MAQSPANALLSKQGWITPRCVEREHGCDYFSCCTVNNRGRKDVTEVVPNHKLPEKVEWLRGNHPCQTQPQTCGGKMVLAPHTHTQTHT